MNINEQDNLGMGVIALGAVLNESKAMSISKLFLIYPLLSHQLLLQYLCRKTTKIISLEKLIIEKISCFTNFNKRYYDALCLTINATQYLNDLDYIAFNQGQVFLKKEFRYNKKMGKRSKRFFDAAKNVSTILNEQSDNLYLNLRIEL